jgi:hypothetical protein
MDRRAGRTTSLETRPALNLRTLLAIIPQAFTVFFMTILVCVLMGISSTRLLGWRQLRKGKMSHSVEPKRKR